MRAKALAVASLAVLCGCGKPASERVASTPPLASCRPDDIARTVAGPTAFAAGWVQLKLVACPGAQAATSGVLEVEGATVMLGFEPGRAGGSTLGVLAAGAKPSGGVQRFPIARLSPSADTVVLAPWAEGAAPSVGQIRLTRGS